LSLDEESRLNLEDDEAAVRAFLREHGGSLKRDPEESGTFWLTLRPRTDPDELYAVRVAWTAYPHEPPSVRFASSVRGSLTTTSAWPTIAGYRPASFDICKPFTAEGFSLHPDWRSGPDAWRTTGNPFLHVVTVLQFDLDNNYSGRSA
jgi:hypothetical protein